MPAFPSVTLAPLIESAGSGSSSLIVPVPVPTPMVALLGALNVTVNVSLASESVSPLTVTAIDCVVCPGANVNVPDAAT